MAVEKHQYNQIVNLVLFMGFSTASFDDIKMNNRKFFKIALFIPILVSLCATVRPWLVCINSTDSYCLNKSIYDYELFIGLYPIIFGGIPYLIFLVASLVWLSRKQPHSVKMFLISSPLVYAGIFITLIGSYYMFLVNLKDALIYSLFLGVYALAYGYLYVVVTAILWFVVKGVGISVNSHTSRVRRNAAPLADL